MFYYAACLRTFLRLNIGLPTGSCNVRCCVCSVACVPVSGCRRLETFKIQRLAHFAIRTVRWGIPRSVIIIGMALEQACKAVMGFILARTMSTWSFLRKVLIMFPIKLVYGRTTHPAAYVEILPKMMDPDFLMPLLKDRCNLKSILDQTVGEVHSLVKVPNQAPTRLQGVLHYIGLRLGGPVICNVTIEGSKGIWLDELKAGSDFIKEFGPLGSDEHQTCWMRGQSLRLS